MNAQTHNIAPSAPLLEVCDVKKHFPVKRGLLSGKSALSVKAVDGVSFTLQKGETLGLVGESGCGKSTLGRAIIRLTEPTSGAVYFKGEDLVKLNPQELRRRRQDFQIIFQDPYSSLNPRMTIGDILCEPFLIQKLATRKVALAEAAKLLEVVGLNSAMLRRYPHEFSGGQRQRISIARALAVNPSFIVCDECVSALDVSVQAQIINLMMSIQQERNIAFLFISHDLRIVKHISKRIAVMYLGRIVELCDSEELFQHTLHPYSQALLSAIPISDPDCKKEKIFLPGDLPSPLNPPSGCHFHTRCPRATDICSQVSPAFVECSSGHYCACHHCG